MIIKLTILLLIFIGLIVAICGTFLIFVLLFNKPITFNELKDDLKKIIYEK